MKRINMNDLVEDLAELEHNQWWDWSCDLTNKEKLSTERKTRWKKLWIPYDELNEKDKEKDREYALKVLSVILKHIN